MIKKIFLILGLGLIIGGGALLVNQRNLSRQNDFETIVSRVSGMMVLPPGRIRVATVTDREKLIQLPFFAKSENGDVLLIFEGSDRVILYRPGIKKIVEVGSVSWGGDQPGIKEEAENKTSVKLVILNGSGRSEAGEVVKNLFEEIEDLEVDSRDYQLTEKTVVMDLTNSYPEIAAEVAGLVGAEVTEEDLAGVEADIAIVLGKDYSE